MRLKKIRILFGRDKEPKTSIPPCGDSHILRDLPKGGITGIMPAPENRPAICVWRTDVFKNHDYADGLWETSCGEIFSFEPWGTPSENKMRYCPYCGRPLREVVTKVKTNAVQI